MGGVPWLFFRWDSDFGGDEGNYLEASKLGLQVEGLGRGRSKAWSPLSRQTHARGSYTSTA
jgi:hypothetical protein